MKDSYSLSGKVLENEISKAIRGELVLGDNFSFAGVIGVSSEFFPDYSTKPNDFAFGFMDPSIKKVIFYLLRNIKLERNPILTGFLLTKKSHSKNNLIGRYYGCYSQISKESVLGLDYMDIFCIEEFKENPLRLLKSLKEQGIRNGFFGELAEKEIKFNWPELGGIADLVISLRN